MEFELDMKSLNMEQIQSQMLSVLIDFDKICKIIGINYSLVGGTLLGAVRYNDFIPWDDDIDVSLFRKDFELLYNYCLSSDGVYKIEFFEGSWVPRFCKKNGNAWESIDIFIWDSINSNRALQFVKINILRFLQGTMKPTVDIKSYALKYRPLILLTSLIGLFFSYNVKVKIYQWVSSHSLQGDRLYIHRSNDNFKSLRYIYSIDLMKDFSKANIRNYEFEIFNNYEELLIDSYGVDYMIPPPLEDRHPSHSLKIE